MPNFSRARALSQGLILLSLVFAGSLQAQQPARPGGAEQKSPWSVSVRGGAVYQFDSDLDDGGSFDVSRFFIQGGVGYGLGPGRRISLSVGYGRDRYDFSGSAGMAGLRPWDRVNQLRFSVPVRWAVDDRWSVFVIPTLRFYGEAGTDFDDSATGGVLAAFSYRFSDSLTLGPGLGILGRLEDDANVFPILVIDWKITERLRLGTGRGLGATQGPGLTLSYQATEAWSLGLSGRYETLRFRLNDRGAAPDGVGEDKSFPLVVNATYSRGRDLQLRLLAGVEFDGELRLENSRGNRIAKEEYDAAPLLGFTFSYRM